MCTLLAKAQEAILYMCLERRFGKISEGQTLTKRQTTLSVLGHIHFGERCSQLYSRSVVKSTEN